MSQFQQIKFEAKALFDSGDFVQACELFKQAHEIDKKDIDVLVSTGLCFANLQDFENTRYWLEIAEKNADKRNSRFPAIAYFHLAKIYHQDNMQDKAIEYYQAAIACHPDFPVAHLSLANLHMARNELEDAEYHYQYAIKLQPENVNAYANLAQVYELSNQVENARLAISKTFEFNSEHTGALLALAKVEKREKNYDEAEKSLNAIIELTDELSIKAMAYIELGHVLDKKKNFNAAFIAATQGKELWSETVQSMPFDKGSYQKKIIANKSYFTADNSNSVVKEVGSQRSPIFFVGFPRSGTTLVEQILNQHAEIVVSDEKPFIESVMQKLPFVTQSKSPYPECLDELKGNEIDQLKQVYWDAVRDELPEFSQRSVLLDKLPLNIIETGFINKLFPDARILVALRDPRDVCLSGFMQAFTPNPAMINFLTMQTTVNFYAEVMGLWLHYRDILPLKWHQYHYEDLVSDFDKTTRDIFTFLDLPYPENASEFHVAAAERSISTPSYQDVATPIYQRSKARWRNYEKQLDSYLGTLEPFITAFDYKD